MLLTLTESGKLEFADLHSMNGTALNGVRLGRGELSSGDVLTLGPDVTLGVKDLDHATRLSVAAAFWNNKASARKTEESSKVLPPMDSGCSTTPPESDWGEKVADDLERTALKHIEQHGSLHEDELEKMLGSQRRARKFAIRLDELRKILPFQVFVQNHDGAKVYIWVKPDE